MGSRQDVKTDALFFVGVVEREPGVTAGVKPGLKKEKDEKKKA